MYINHELSTVRESVWDKNAICWTLGLSLHWTLIELLLCVTYLLQEETSHSLGENPPAPDEAWQISAGAPLQNEVDILIVPLQHTHIPFAQFTVYVHESF